MTDPDAQIMPPTKGRTMWENGVDSSKSGPDAVHQHHVRQGLTAAKERL